MQMSREIIESLLYELPLDWNEITERRLTDKDGKLHSADQPALLRGKMEIFSSGNVYRRAHHEEWRLHDVLHREGGLPARIQLAGYGLTTAYTIEYYEHGLLHNEHGPARIEVTRGGHLIKVEYYLRGKRSRKGGPAIIRYNYVQAQKMDREAWREPAQHRQPEVSSFAYYKDDLMHRDGGPARGEFPRESTFEHMVWAQNGLIYNPDGAAETWHEHGELVEIFRNAQGQKIRKVVHYTAA